MQPPTFVFTFNPDGTVGFDAIVTPGNHVDGTIKPDGTIVCSSSINPGAISATTLPGFNIAALLKLFQDIASGASFTVIMADFLGLFTAPAPAPST